MTERTAPATKQLDSIGMAESTQTDGRCRRVRPSLRWMIRRSSNANPRRRRWKWTPEFRLGRAEKDTGEPGSALRQIFDSEARLSWIYSWLAGFVGAAAFTHASFFVGTATGNAQRAAAGVFINDLWLSISATLLVASFLAGVIVGSLCRRHIWKGHPHGAAVITTLCLAIAAISDVLLEGWSTGPVVFLPILAVAFGIGALNTAFVKNGEVAVALSYVTGTVVKLGQGIERHISGGSAADWLGHFLLFASFVAGGLAGGGMCLLVSGSQLLVAAAVVSALTTGYNYFFTDRRAAGD